MSICYKVLLTAFFVSFTGVSMAAADNAINNVKAAAQAEIQRTANHSARLDDIEVKEIPSPAMERRFSVSYTEPGVRVTSLFCSGTATTNLDNDEVSGPIKLNCGAM